MRGRHFHGVLTRTALHHYYDVILIYIFTYVIIVITVMIGNDCNASNDGNDGNAGKLGNDVM